MIRHWLIAALIALVVAAVTFQVTVARTPGFLMNAAFNRLTRLGAANTMLHGPLATAEARTIVRPSPDLAYSSCPYDLAAGPVLIEALPIAAPYWSLSVFDAHTDVAFVRNNRQSGNRPIRIALVKPGVSAPPGYEPVAIAAGDRGVALIRILVPDRAAFGPVDAARRLSGCRGVVAP